MTRPLTILFILAAVVAIVAGLVVIALAHPHTPEVWEPTDYGLPSAFPRSPDRDPNEYVWDGLPHPAGHEQHSRRAFEWSWHNIRFIHGDYGVPQPPQFVRFDPNELVTRINLRPYLAQRWSISNIAGVYVWDLPDIVYLLPGDCDMDGDVDFEDFAYLAIHYGMSGHDLDYTYAWADGDFDGDNDVDFTDFGLMGANYGLSIWPALGWLRCPITTEAPWRYLTEEDSDG